jgi:HK97 family phage portal protein
MRLFPRRVKSTATTPQEIEAMILAQYTQSLSGISVSPNDAIKVPEVLACINVIAQSFSMLPFHLMQKKDESREKVTDSPVYKVLGQKPNGFQSPLEFRRTMTFNAAWQGNAYAHAQKLGGRLLQLVPIANSRVTPKLQDDYSIEYHIKGTSGQPNTDKVYTEDEIFHLRGPICPAGWLSDSPIVVGREPIATMIAMDRYAGKLFLKESMARGAFKLPQMESLSDEEFDRLKASLNASTESGEIPLLEQGLEYLKMDYSARESQFSEMASQQINKLCRLWRIQPHMIQSLKDATFSNIEHQSREFVDHTLMPWIQLWESAIKMQLMDPAREDTYPKFSVQALLRGDNATRAAFYQSAVGGPWMAPNEARQFEDMNSVEGGDELLKPLNMTGAEEQSDATDTQEAVSDAE